MFSHQVSVLQTRAPESAGKPIKWCLQRIGWCARRFERGAFTALGKFKGSIFFVGRVTWIPS